MARVSRFCLFLALLVTGPALARAEVPVVGDFDGDGLADLGLYDAAGIWSVRLSGSGQFIATQFGNPALGDTPIIADWDGNGLTDLAVYRQSTGEWFVFLLGRPDLGPRQLQRIVFGAAGGDLPVLHDMDGDGFLDIALYRPATRTWFLLDSRTGTVQTIALPR